jgi:hypothetical protein
LLPLGDNAFKIMLASKPEQPFTIAVDVGAVQEPFALPGYDRPQPQLPLNQRQVSQVLAIAPQQIESIEPWFATAEQPLRGSFGGLGNGNGTSGEVILFEQTAKSHLTSMMKQD